MLFLVIANKKSDDIYYCKIRSYIVDICTKEIPQFGCLTPHGGMFFIKLTTEFRKTLYAKAIC